MIFKQPPSRTQTAACAANHECRSFVINPAGNECALYKGNPGDGNQRSWLAYVEALGFQIFMSVPKGKQGLAITGIRKYKDVGKSYFV